MKKKQEIRGAPKGNKNAAGMRGRKQYIQVFGQRWDVLTGEQILSYLERTGQSQKQYLSRCIERDILSVIRVKP